VITLPSFVDKETNKQTAEAKSIINKDVYKINNHDGLRKIDGTSISFPNFLS
jgi:hypothetical protein